MYFVDTLSLGRSETNRLRFVVLKTPNTKHHACPSSPLPFKPNLIRIFHAPLPSQGAAVTAGEGQAEHEANWPVVSFGLHTSNGTCASPQIYLQQGLKGVGQAAMLLREQVEVLNVEVGFVEVGEVRQLQALEIL